MSAPHNLPGQIREFKEGDDDIQSAARLNEIVLVANAARNMRGGPGIKITHAASGIHIERTNANQSNQRPG